MVELKSNNFFRKVYKDKKMRINCMVHVVTYMKTFAKVMPRRTTLLHKALLRKYAIDKLIAKRGYGTRKQLIELLDMMGEDTLFRPAEKRNRQTVRHYLWKLQKGLQFISSRRGKLIGQIEKNVQQKRVKKTLEFFEEATAYAKISLQQLVSLDHIIQKEVLALEKIRKDPKFDWNTYLTLLEEEYKIRLYAIEQSEVISSRARTFSTYVQILTREIKEYGQANWAILILIGYIFYLVLVPSLVAYDPHTMPLIKQVRWYQDGGARFLLHIFAAPISFIGVAGLISHIASPITNFIRETV